MSRRRSVTIGAAALLLVTGLVAWRWLWPWLAFPELPAAEIEARWAAVVRLAGPEYGVASESPGLREVASEWQASGQALRGDDDGRTTIEVAALEPGTRRAIEALVRWAEAGGEAPGTCPADPAHQSVVGLFKVGELALRSAVAPDDPAFTAALRLGAALRGRGELLASTIGFSLADRALEVVQARGWDARATLAGLRPTEAELRGALAREAVCSLRMIDGAFAGCERGEMSVPWYYPLSARQWCERERLGYQDFVGRVHERVAAARIDELAAVFASTEESLPSRSVTATLMAVTARPVERLTGQLARQDAALGPATPGR